MRTSVPRSVATVNFGRSAPILCTVLLLFAGCAGRASSFDPLAQRFATTRTTSRPGTSGTYRVLYSIGQNPGDGTDPVGRLTELKGILYGVTADGPGSNGGTIFGVRPTGGERVVCTIQGASLPNAGLTAARGMLYGTAQIGGAYGRGAVFETSPKCSTRLLYSFHGARDGKRPAAVLLYLNGMLYGTTQQGGFTYGTAFSVSLAGQEQVLHRFQGNGDDGIWPTAGFVDVRGTLYGTTASSGGSSEGAAYSLSLAGKEHVLYRFPGRPYDGSHPGSELVNVNGRLYGSTPYGGLFGYGTVFAITTGGRERVIYNFGFDQGTAGAYPGPLTYANGRLYGTTSSGGTSDYGTLFSVTTSGSEETLYDFKDEYPSGLLYAAGVLYGTTDVGGQYGQGTVFAFTP